jgi:hypothetical protein
VGTPISCNAQSSSKTLCDDDDEALLVRNLRDLFPAETTPVPGRHQGFRAIGAEHLRVRKLRDSPSVNVAHHAILGFSRAGQVRRGNKATVMRGPCPTWSQQSVGPRPALRREVFPNPTKGALEQPSHMGQPPVHPIRPGEIASHASASQQGASSRVAGSLARNHESRLTMRVPPKLLGGQRDRPGSDAPRHAEPRVEKPTTREDRDSGDAAAMCIEERRLPQRSLDSLFVDAQQRRSHDELRAIGGNNHLNPSSPPATSFSVWSRATLIWMSPRHSDIDPSCS